MISTVTNEGYITKPEENDSVTQETPADDIIEGFIEVKNFNSPRFEKYYNYLNDQTSHNNVIRPERIRKVENGYKIISKKVPGENLKNFIQKPKTSPLSVKNVLHCRSNNNSS